MQNRKERILLRHLGNCGVPQQQKLLFLKVSQNRLPREISIFEEEKKVLDNCILKDLSTKGSISDCILRLHMCFEVIALNVISSFS